MDYKKTGLKIGLEIHQRLDTEKLFCSCSSAQRNEPAGSIVRQLRPVMGETGSVDSAASHEFLRSRTFVYRLYPQETCLVEADEEPPHSLNKDALLIALQMAKLLDADVVDEIHVMRKTVIDGSNTSGFQRTAVVALDGKLKTSGGIIGIPSISVEEEAARIEGAEGSSVIYKLNGLGIPLIEISTTPDISTPEQAKEVAQKLGELLRACKVQRGIGSIRQDINISIAAGARIEMKGFQELNEIPKVIETEVARQLSLVSLAEELRKRKFKPVKGYDDVTHVFAKARNNFIKKDIEEGKRVYAVHVPSFGGLMKKEVGDKTLAKELIGYITPFGLRGFIHSDEDIGKYNLVQEFEELKKKYKPGHDDLILIISASAAVAEKALPFLISRINHCAVGVPEETRTAAGTGSVYSRPLPGASRMYPETDVPTVVIDEAYLEGIKKPKTLETKETELLKKLPKELAKQIVKSKYNALFEKLCTTSVDPVFIATTLLSTMKDMKRRGIEVDKINDYEIERLFKYLDKGEITKDAVPAALEKMAAGASAENVLEAAAPLTEDEVVKIIRKAVKENESAKEAAIMGIVMHQISGRYAGAAVMKLVRREMK